jgi:hypothetical protein
MGKATTFSNNLLKLVLNATAFANVADNAASAPVTNTYVALHTADPGAGGNQSTSETSYTSYVRQAVARTSGGWTITNNVANPVANVVFPISTGTTPTITHFSVGKTSSGATDLWWSGTVTPNIVVSLSVTQTLTSASTITES